MAIEAIWTEETLVRTSETDFQQRWKPAHFFLTMQEAAANHADHLGYSYQEMLAQDMVWVLSRTKIRFYAFPRLEERVIIQTWPKGLQQKLFFMRDFRLSSPDGRRYADASSAYILINPKARRLLMPSALTVQVPDNGGQGALDEPLDKLNPPEDLPECLTVEARYSAVDLMGHVNNARYVEWICDCFPMEDYARRELSWMQLNFINEIRPGEQVRIHAGAQAQDPSVWTLQGNNLNTNKPAFEAAVGWKG